MYVQRNTEARSRTPCCRGKAVSITLSECLSVALVSQHTTRMRRIILSPHFSTLSHKRQDFLEKLSNIKRVFCFRYNFYVKDFSFSA